jgi:hypothetical protein
METQRAASPHQLGRSVWSAASLLPLSNGLRGPKSAGKPGHSKRVAQIGINCGLRACVNSASLPLNAALRTKLAPASDQALEYFRQSALIFSTSLGTPVIASSLPSYSADM